MEAILFHQPFKMIVVSMTAVIILLLGLLIYRYIYPKKNINLFLLLILISILPTISIFRVGSYQSGDLSLHTKFAMQFFDNLREGVLIPEWIKNHCSGYGCPAYLFLFMLPYYLISLLHFTGIPFLMSTKIVLALSFIISGIGMYVWIKDELGKVPGFVASLFFLFSPYHLIDLSFRVSIGETVSMAIFPFLFYSSKRYIETKKPIYFVLNGILFPLLILSHQVTSFVILPLVIIYSVYVWFRISKKSFSILLKEFLSLFIGILLAAFYWLPILTEAKYTKYGTGIDISFSPFSDFFYSPNRFGLLFQGHMGELYFNIGYVQWIIIAVSIYLFFFNKVHGKDKKLLGGVLILFAIFFFMMLSISKPIWEITPIIKDFEFAWRLMIETMIFPSIMAAIIVKTYPNKKFIVLLCFVTVMYTILNWGNRQTEPQINDAVLRNQQVFTEKRGKWGIDFTSPVWVNEYMPWIGIVPKSHIVVLSGKAQIVQLKRVTVKHEYIINAETNVRIKENTYYYPGWEILANNQIIPINYKDKTYPGIMIFNLKKGLYKIDVIFTNTWDRLLGKWVSGITAIILLFYVIYSIISVKLLKRISSSPKR